MNATDIFCSYGVVNGKERLFVSIDGREKEFPFDSDVDLQIDIFNWGCDKLEVRDVMRHMRIAREQWNKLPDDIPCAQERAHPQERPAGGRDDTRTHAGGFLSEFRRGYAIGIGVSVVVVPFLLFVRWWIAN